MEVRDKIRAGEYETKLHFFRSGERRKAYDIDVRRLEEKFKADLEEEWFGKIEHPKKNLLFEMAWEYGHASGLEEVCTHYESFIRLLER